MWTRILALVLLIVVGPLEALADKRVALVMGVGDYANAKSLDNPTRDATAVANALRGAGFDVQLSLNSDQNDFGEEILAFYEKTKGADAAVFYFAGHGIQLNAKNYLLARDAKVKNPLLIDQDGFELGRILDLMSQNAKTSIAIIDACRDNPMAEALYAKMEPASRSAWGMSRGLARVEAEFTNSLVAFATAPGRVAFDGTGTHSPFTNALLRHIGERGLEISVMLKRVTSDVLEETKGTQRPEVVASMAREFYFYQPDITVEGDVVLMQPESAEATALEFLRLAMDLPKGAERTASLESVVGRFEHTAASDIARQLLESEAVAKVVPKAPAATAAPKAEEPFDTALLDGLAISTVPPQAEAEQADTATTPEGVEAALNLTRSDIVKIQGGLNTMGYDLGSVDGSFGPKSRSALRSFQVASRIPQTGFLDRKTIDALLKAVAEAPRTYDGMWELIVYREWLVDDRGHAPNTKGTREILVSANLAARDNRFFIENFTYRTIEPYEPFSDFDATFTASGQVRITGGISTHFRDPEHVVPKMRNLSVRLQLPVVVPKRRGVESGANRIDGSLKFHVELKRRG